MNVEHKLLCKALHSGEFASVIKAGIKPAHFTGSKARGVFKDMRAYLTEYAGPPTLDVVRMDHPTFEMVAVEESLDYLIQQVRKTRRYSLAEMGLTEAVEAWEEGDVDDVVSILQEMLVKMADDAPAGTDTDITQTVADRLEYYRMLADPDSPLSGIPFGFEGMDMATRGAHPGWMVTVTGIAKARKTTALLHMARSAHKAGHRPLLMSFEMSAREIGMRLDAGYAGISEQRLRNGELTEHEWIRLEKALKRLEDMEEFLLTEDASASTTVSTVAARIEEHKPDILYLDGAYFLTDEISGERETNRALTGISRSIKRMAARYEIPIILTTQSLRSKMGAKGLHAGSIGNTAAFEQDSELVIGIESTDDPMYSKLKIMAYRWGPLAEWTLRIDADTSKIEELTEDPFGMEEPDDSAYAGW